MNHGKSPVLSYQALLQARASEDGSPAQQVLNRVIGIIFLGTPFRGSPVAEAAQLRIQVVRSFGKETHQALIDDLCRQNGRLDELVHEFGEFVHRPSSRIPIKCFYERKYTNVTKALGWKSLTNWFPKQVVVCGSVSNTANQI
jgi:hypothetical protein